MHAGITIQQSYTRESVIISLIVTTFSHFLPLGTARNTIQHLHQIQYETVT
jgi:hypothetical protein